MSGQRIIAQSATMSSVDVVCIVRDRKGRPRPRLGVHVTRGSAEVAVEDEIDLASMWTSSQTSTEMVWIAKTTIADLAPGTEYALELRDGTEALATALATTLPDRKADRFSLIVGSCFDIESKWAQILSAAYDKALPAPGTPTYNLWVGDQVYVDAPWQDGWKMSDARDVIYGKYLRVWGVGPKGIDDSALAQAMVRTSNWYLSDDHEFWNGYPHPSWLTMPVETTKRIVQQIWRRRPKGPDPHPSSQGPWGRVAGEAYCTFQSPARFGTFDESVSPPALQTIEIDGALVVLADTRWRRTISKTGERAGFMMQRDLDELTALLRSNTDRLVCLVLPKPLIGHLPHRGASRGKVEYGPEDYTAQYLELWSALTDRANVGAPTMTIGGDVHRHAVRRALDGALIEVVSSPMALLSALDDESKITRLRKLWRSVGATWGKLKALARIGESKVRGEDTVVVDTSAELYPKLRPGEDWVAAVGDVPFVEGGAKRSALSGVAGIDFDLSTAGRPAVTIRNVIASNRSAPGTPQLQTVEPLTYRWNGTSWAADDASEIAADLARPVTTRR